MSHPTTPQVERRIAIAKGTELRVVRADGAPTRLVGHAAVFGQLSEDLGGFREQIAVGAFSDCLTNDVRCLINHDSNLVLGRTTARTLTLSEDLTGLAIDCPLPDTSYARDLAISMERGDISQMSFSFTVTREGEAWARDGSGPWIRTVKKCARLYDVSPVTYPAYPTTDAALRSLADWQKLHPEVDYQAEARARRIRIRALEGQV